MARVNGNFRYIARVSVELRPDSKQYGIMVVSRPLQTPFAPKHQSTE